MAGQTEDAIKYYQKVLAINPNLIDAKRRLAILKGEAPPTETTFGHGGTYQEPIPGPAPSPELGTALTPGSPTLNQADQAQAEQFRRLLQINPLNEPIARKLANFYRTKNMHKEAVAELTLLADAYMQRGMYAKAEPIYQEIIREAPSDELKQKLAKSKSLKKSMDAINQAIKSYKTDLNISGRKTG